MNSDTKLLKEIYCASINAITIISSLLERLGDDELFDTLFSEMTEYRKIANDAIVLLNNFGIHNVSQNFLDYFSLNAAKQLIKNCHNKSYARGILIRGSIDGITNLTEHINTCTDAKKETRLLAYRLIEVEENNVKILKTEKTGK